MSEAGDVLKSLDETYEKVMLPTRDWHDPKYSEVRIAINPSSVDRMLSELGIVPDSQGKMNLRLLVDTQDQKLYVWDSLLVIHHDAAIGLGLDYSKCIRGEATFRNGLWESGCEDKDWRVKDLDQQVYAECVARVRELFGDGK